MCALRMSYISISGTWKGSTQLNHYILTKCHIFGPLHSCITVCELLDEALAK